jgi:LPXTG-motif cell wall-anchored protein
MIPDAQLYVRSRLVQLRFPIGNGGLIWNRPVAIVVRPLNGQEKVIPVLDMTRIALFTLVGICFTGIFAFMFLKRKKAKT